MKTLMNTCLMSISLLFIVVACSSNNVLSQTPTVEIAETSITPIRSTTSAPTSTGILLAVIPSPTSLPDFNLDTARQVLAKFVQENGGCRLPCLLGLSPIDSNRSSVELLSQYFQAHSQRSDDQLNSLSIYSHYNADYGGVKLVFWKNRVRVDIGIGVSFINDNIDYIGLSTGVYKHTGEGANESAEILSRHPNYDELLGHFSLSNILIDYGKPNEIWVRPFPEDELHRSTYVTGSYPFDFVLIYPDRGFAIEYIARVKDEGDGYLTGCPSTAYMKIASWNPERRFQFAEIAKYFEGTDSLSVSNFTDFKQLQDVTSIKVQDFYNQYKDSTFSECVKTLRDLWP